MRPTDSSIVQAALEASTSAQAMDLQSLIEASVGGRHERPLGDRPQNLGMLGSGGSFDVKLIEQVTNMQDAVIERLVLEKWGTRDRVPYLSPAEAAADLLHNKGDSEVSELATIRFAESDGAPSKSKKLTAIFRDQGTGIGPADVSESLFRLGGSNKEDALYLQGAFGLGGALTYRNAESVVLVSRRNPNLLAPGEEDRIAVAVVEWRQGRKGQTALYLVTQPWQKPGDTAEVWSCPASAFPGFGPGTSLSLISYRVDGIYRAFESDEKSFPSVLNTRLFRPVMPVLFTNETARGRNTTIRGLERKLANSEHQFTSGTETLIFKYKSETYHLPIAFTIFEANGPGSRRSLVAHDHAVLFLSNGQVHHHWTIDEFKSRTAHNKLRNRVLVTVETDDLPITFRTALFTADRSSLVKADIALRLEEEVRAFIDSWDSLRDANTALIREALSDSLGESSASVGQRIGRAILATGFSNLGGTGTSGDLPGGGGGTSGGGGGTTKPIELLPDPTYLRGPLNVVAERSRTFSRSYAVNAPDDFLESRGQLQVEIDHPDIDLDRDISVGQLRNGRVRVQVALPDSMELGNHTLKLKIEDWFRMSGGLGPRLDFVTDIEVVDEIHGQGSGNGSRSTGGAGESGAGSGTNIALRWTHANDDGITRKTVGVVDQTPAFLLADADPENYGSLANLGDHPIPTITLNSDYSPLKKYLSSRSKELDSLERPRDRYAIGVGVALLLLDAQVAKEAADSNGSSMSDEMLAAAQEAAARAVLAVMPAFDDIARESGLTS